MSNVVALEIRKGWSENHVVLQMRDNNNLPIKDPTPPVNMVHWPPWSMAIAIFPTMVYSPRPRGGSNSPEGVDQVSFGVAMLTIWRQS